jgi:hypothetical protein
MKFASKTAWWSVGIWFAIAGLTLLASDWLTEVNIFLPMVTVPLVGLGGLVIMAALALSGEGKAVGVLIVAALVLVLLPLPSWGGRLWFFISFNQHRQAYDAVVAEADGLPRDGNRHGVAYRIEPGPPIRVAFPQPVGIADNWGAVIHDPSDGVATAKGWGETNGDYTIRPDLQELWGGDIVSCSRITGHYYRCWFT